MPLDIASLLCSERIPYKSYQFFFHFRTWPATEREGERVFERARERQKENTRKRTDSQKCEKMSLRRFKFWFRRCMYA